MRLRYRFCGRGLDIDVMWTQIWRSSKLSTTTSDSGSIALVVVAAEVLTPTAHKRYELL